MEWTFQKTEDGDIEVLCDGNSYDMYGSTQAAVDAVQAYLSTCRGRLVEALREASEQQDNCDALESLLHELKDA